jgi:arylformamidase
MAASQWIDISTPLENGVVTWPGDPLFSSTRIADMSRGDSCNVTAVAMPAHTGTHVDAPLHFLAAGGGVETIPLDAFLGPARVIVISDPVAVRAAELARHDIPLGGRVLFKTRNSAQSWHRAAFIEDFVYIARDAAELLVEQQVRLVGVDYLSVGKPGDEGAEVHRILLTARMCLLEGLQLAAVQPGDYELACLPLKLMGADGAPARAVLRPLHSA